MNVLERGCYVGVVRSRMGVYLMLTELTDSLRGCWGVDADLYQRLSRDQCEERQTFQSNSPASRDPLRDPEGQRERKNGEEQEGKKNGRRHLRSTFSKMQTYAKLAKHKSSLYNISVINYGIILNHAYNRGWGVSLSFCYGGLPWWSSGPGPQM